MVVNKNLWLVGVSLSVGRHRFNIINVYHSPNSNSAFLDKLEEVLNNYAIKSESFILIGDLNINLAKETYYSKKLNNIIERSGLSQIVQNFTRITPTSATIIDLIITNDKEVNHQIHLTPKIADHSILTVNLPSTELGQNKEIYRDMRNFNELEFQLDLMDMAWPDGNGNIDIMANCLVKGIMENLNKHAPLKERITTNKWGNKKWWTPEIKMEITERDRFYKRAIITGDVEDWTKFKQKRNAVVQIIKDRKQAYYHEKIDECKGDSKEMWRSLKSIISNKNKSKNNKESIDFLMKNVGGGIEDIEDILENIESPKKHFESFQIQTFTELKSVVGEVINTSLEKGCFPKEWKTSMIIPIEKVNNTNKCDEFRPINMVSTCEKLLETVVSDQMRKFVEEIKSLLQFKLGLERNIPVKVLYNQ
ncbi:uncharacterized protein LOC115879515 [Sitophilus oryzae]|uniref:Uncharacterized protein LOC115879515 n=1 Tax=Sitophilus oryzae TaxID=7048 RepID=A0A6J2XN34_SITOR|nr:uncharacterized protein LOC115879515 [Sitophilus oryzae]